MTTTTRYITNADYRRQKTALTRAVNSSDPLKVLATVEKTLEEWRGLVWPDEWSRWSSALYDAHWAWQRLYLDGAEADAIRERFDAAEGRLSW